MIGRFHGTSSRARSAAAFAIAASLAGAPSLSAAQPVTRGETPKLPASGKAALERFDAAQKLFDRGKHADALALFQKVSEETKSPNARLMAARCLLALGRTAEAYDELYATVREAAARAQSEPKYARTRDAAAAELGVLEPKIGKLIIALADPSVTVTLNGAKLAPDRLGVPMAVAPGSMAIVATKPDGTSVKREETVGAGQTRTITLVFPTAPAALPKATPSPAPPIPDQAAPATVKTGGGVRVAGFVIAGLGVAGMGAFGATFAVAQSKFNTLKSECGGVRCTDPKYASVVDSGKSMELVSNISLIAGALALAGGTAMIIFGGPSSIPQPKAGVWSNATIAVSPHGGELRFQGAF